MKKENHPWWMEIDPQAEFENIPAVELAKSKIREMDDLEKKLASKMDDKYFEALHDKIMKKVETTEIAPPKPWGALPKKAKAFGLSLSVLALILMVSSIKSPDASLTVSDPVTTQSLNNIDDLSISILVAETSDQFFVDVAGQNLNDLAVRQLATLMGQVKHLN
jgi:hypothetical protein